MWARPTFEVNGLLSGFTGEGAKTVLPAMAMAKVSMRLVPDQDPQKIAELFEAYVQKICPKTVELKITRMHGGKPWMTEFDNKYVRAAGRAIEQGFGKAPVFNREGGSIPVVSTFQEELGLPSVLFGVGLPDENAHAPTRSSISATSTTASSRPRTCIRRSRIPCRLRSGRLRSASVAECRRRRVRYVRLRRLSSYREATWIEMLSVTGSVLDAGRRRAGSGCGTCAFRARA